MNPNRTRTVSLPKLAPRSERIEDALHELLRQIDEGAEYPDAQFRISQKFRITGDELQDAYDSLG